MTDTNSTLERFHALPRAAQWLAYAAAFIAAFFAWDTSIGQIGGAWNADADEIQAQVRTVRASSSTAQRLEKMDDTVIGLGRVRKPRRAAEGRAALTRAASEVVQARIGKEPSFDLGGGDRLRADLASGIVRPGYQVTRLTGTLKFEATPADAIAIIAGLEDREEIASIRKVTIAKADSRNQAVVDVNLTLETWVEVPARKRR